jgi:hypothetical protein
MDEATQEVLKEYFGEWLKEIAEWRAAHPKAKLFEIEEYARTQRRELMSRVLKPVVEGGAEETDPKATVFCPECEATMPYKGKPSRQVETREAPFEIERSYHHCSSCGKGLFPPR